MIKGMLCGAALGFSAAEACGCGGASSADEISPAEREAMQSVAMDFMRKFDVPGLSVAISRGGRIVYENAIGESDRTADERLATSSLFRIASVTKPITSAAIFTLIEKGQLQLQDRVFGANAVLGTKYGNPPYKGFVEDITIDHLLTHTCGGWDNSNDDPMFANPAMDHFQLISWTLDAHLLKNPPGSHWAYSNFGYCVLGRVIEQVSGRAYADYAQGAILGACGVRDMRIAGNTVTERAANEVIYYGQNGEDPYNMNVTRMDSHGGWLATPKDLVLFLNHVDGFKATPNILKPETIRQMTTPSAANSRYARGWAVNNLGNWWHSGSLPGTSTIMVRTSAGYCWAALTNTRGKQGMDLALDNMVWEMARKVRAWKL
ncbi:MAG: serine hydrolase domain-containing protein [Candidatus Acidiferrum sp.]